jgi:hypothetical protein
MNTSEFEIVSRVARETIELLAKKAVDDGKLTPLEMYGATYTMEDDGSIFARYGNKEVKLI